MRSLITSLLLALSSVAAPLRAQPDPLATLRAGHPRLLFTNEQLAQNLAAAKTDPARAALHVRIVAIAEAQLKEKPVERVLVGPRLLDKSRSALDRVLSGAMAWRLTGDVRYAERAKHELLAVAAFSDWNPSHFLDVAEMSTAVGLGYDWLFHYLTPEERATLRTALVTKGLAFAPAAYASPATDKRLWFAKAHHNWNQVCNGGLLTAALALADEEPGLARTVITGAVKSLPLAMTAYAPDGAYPEGPGYWSYGTSYNVLALAALESALSTDFDLGKASAFDRTALYRLHIQSPLGLSFNYADGGAGMSAAPEYTWLAQRYAQPAELAHSRALLAHVIATKKPGRENDRFFALHAVWFPSETAAAAAPLDAHFRGPAQLALFRSAWDDPRAVFLGFKAGSNAVNHSHLDLGSFVLDADGVRWAQDLGPDDYNLPNYFDTKVGGQRWTYLRLNNHSHNTLTPGGALQNSKADAPIIAYGSTPARAFAIADLTAAYPGSAKKIQRGITLLDRARVLVQDEVTDLAARTPLTWRLVTDAKIRIIDDHHAELTQADRTLRVEILEPDAARFTITSATPPTSTERQNKASSILVAELPAAPDLANARLAVLLTPTGEHWPTKLPPVAITPLDRW